MEYIEKDGVKLPKLTLGGLSALLEIEAIAEIFSTKSFNIEDTDEQKKAQNSRWGMQMMKDIGLIIWVIRNQENPDTIGMTPDEKKKRVITETTDIGLEQIPAYIKLIIQELFRMLPPEEEKKRDVLPSKKTSKKASGI